MRLCLWQDIRRTLNTCLHTCLLCITSCILQYVTRTINKTISKSLNKSFILRVMKIPILCCFIQKSAGYQKGFLRDNNTEMRRNVINHIKEWFSVCQEFGCRSQYVNCVLDYGQLLKNLKFLSWYLHKCRFSC